MRFKQFLSEMAFRAGNLDSEAGKHAKNNVEDWKKSPVIAKVGSLEIKKLSQYYSLWDDGKFVLNVRTKELDDGIFEIDDVYSDSSVRSKGYASKFLDLLFSELGAKAVLLGNKHSDDTYNLLKIGGFSKYKKKWHNVRTGQDVEFDKDDMDKYYGTPVWLLYLHK